MYWGIFLRVFEVLLCICGIFVGAFQGVLGCIGLYFGYFWWLLWMCLEGHSGFLGVYLGKFLVYCGIFWNNSGVVGGL